MVKVKPQPAGLLLDFFPGRGTSNEVAARHGRDYLLVNNTSPIGIMTQRLASTNP